MDDSDGESERPPPGWTKSASEWEWEQARRRRLERVAQKMKLPGSAQKGARAAAKTDAAETEDEVQSGVRPRRQSGEDARRQSAHAQMADDPDINELLQKQNALQALCDLKDSRIAKEAGAAAALRTDLELLRAELEKVSFECAMSSSMRYASQVRMNHNGLVHGRPIVLVTWVVP
jgi:hypothetical protein